jgi:predicted MFS family arabinose efflux permease
MRGGRGVEFARPFFASDPEVLMSDAVLEDATPTPATTASLAMTSSEWLLLLVLAAVQFTHIVDFMIMMPLGPRFKETLNIGPGPFSHLVAAYTISAGLASLLAARFLDRFDRKRALLVLYTGFGVGTLLCGIAPNYELLLAARTVAGAFGGVAAATVLAIVGDAFADKRRGTAMGVIMSAFSVASIVGVPVGLMLATYYESWHAPFFALGAVSLGFLVMAAFALPPLRGHLGGRSHPSFRETWQVLVEPNHVRAFLLMLSLVVSSFTVVPFIATYLQYNVGIQKTEVPFVYLVGGLTTLFTLRYIGIWSDLSGKLFVFRILALLTLVPLLALTNLPHGFPLWAVLLVTALLFVVTSGRMVPATALITNSAAPRVRGSFMSLNSAVQHFGSGFAVWLGGLMLGQATEEGSSPLEGYWVVGLLAATAALASVALAGRLRPAAGGADAPDAAVVHHERSVVVAAAAGD